MLNAFAETFYEQALDQARASEARYAGRGGPVRPLDGLPVAVKEEAEIAGQRNTLGSLPRRDVVAEQTTAFAQRIIDAGAIVHARITTPGVLLRADHLVQALGRYPQSVEHQVLAGRCISPMTLPWPVTGPRGARRSSPRWIGTPCGCSPRSAGCVPCAGTTCSAPTSRPSLPGNGSSGGCT